ncbi:MAG TPA: NAD-dependent epimerase/dehydratase family protein [Acidimicrobiales bacterium]
MRVAVTGATGFVGAHTTRALVRHGHEVRALVRDGERLVRAAADLGIDAPEAVVGDMADPRAVDELLAGCDAVVHAAAVVSLDRRRAGEMGAANPAGLRAVAGRAAALGLDPIVHVSSTSALFRPGAGPLRTDLAVAAPSDPYARSKAASEAVARRLQGEGVPVAITYPSGILGPSAGGAVGAATAGIARFVATGCIPTRDAALSVIDVRDLADVHARLLEPGRGPRRVMCGGHLVTMAHLAQVLRDLTGRRFPVLPVPAAALRLAGRALDAVRRVAPVAFPLTADSMGLVTWWEGTDDAEREALGVGLRPLPETIGAALVACVDAGVLAPRHVGRLAASTAPTRGSG